MQYAGMAILRQGELILQQAPDLGLSLYTVQYCMTMIPVNVCI